jgi:hypothetical protein
MEVVYDPRAAEEERAGAEAEEAVAAAAERKEMEERGGAWGSRLRSRVGRPSAPLPSLPKRRKVKVKKEAVTRTMYLVRWKGYDEESWVTEDQLKYSQEAIEEYERKQIVDQAARSDDSVAVHCLHAWTVSEQTRGAALWCCAMVL